MVGVETDESSSPSDGAERGLKAGENRPQVSSRMPAAMAKAKVGGRRGADVAAQAVVLAGAEAGPEAGPVGRALAQAVLSAAPGLSPGRPVLTSGVDRYSNSTRRQLSVSRTRLNMR
jgi:hypothetical protein